MKATTPTNKTKTSSRTRATKTAAAKTRHQTSVKTKPEVSNPQKEWELGQTKKKPLKLEVQREAVHTASISATCQQDLHSLYTCEKSGKSPYSHPLRKWSSQTESKIGDEQARERMIKANLKVGCQNCQGLRRLRTTFAGPYQRGNIGLMKAVDKFDPTKGAKFFSTYSSWWIKQAIKRSLSNQSKTIRLPIHLVEKIAKRQVSVRLQEVLGREPSDEELAKELEVAPARVAMMRRASTRPCL